MQYEIEKKSLVSESKYKELLEFYSKNAKAVSHFNRFSIIYFNPPNIDEQIDLRIKITGKSCILSMKCGDWKKQLGRKEIDTEFSLDNLENLLETLHVLGFSIGTTILKERHDYNHKGFDISLDKYKGEDSAVIEVEKTCGDSNSCSSLECEVEGYLKQIGLKIITEKEFLKFIDKINARPKWSFDFNKTPIPEWITKNSIKFL